MFINHKGRRRSKKTGDKATANKVAKEVRARLAKGELGMIKTACPTVVNYGSKWLDSPLQEWVDSTARGYEIGFRLHIKPYFGSKRLDEIKRRDVKAFIAVLKGKGLAHPLYRE